MDIWDRVQGVRPSPSVEDRWVWVPGSHDSFFITSAWETIRPHSSRVGWSGLLWGGGNIPKHSFCAWLAIRDRLGTRDRLSRWDRSIPLSRLLCGGNYESRDHLFFSCHFGWEVWSRILLLMSSSHRIGYWEECEEKTVAPSLVCYNLFHLAGAKSSSSWSCYSGAYGCIPAHSVVY